MSTNSANKISLEDDGSVTETPPQSMQKCTRGSPCSRPDCISCTGPVNNSHVLDLTDDLEVTPVKPTSLPDHWIIILTKSFKEAIQNQYPDELEMLIDRYKQNIKALTNNKLSYDRTKISRLNHDATKLLATLLATPIQTPNPPPPSYTFNQHKDEQTGRANLVRRNVRSLQLVNLL